MVSALQSPIKKVLLINIFGIGDVLFTTPLISNLKSFNPDFSIGYLCNRRTACVFENNPKISRVFVYERDEFKAVYQQSRVAYLKKVRALIEEIKREQFDVVLDVSLNHFMGFISFSAKIPQRIGFDYKGRGKMLNYRIPLQGYENKHVVEYYMDLLKVLDVPVKTRNLEIFPSKEDQLWADNFLFQNNLSPNKRLIGLVPGGGASWGKDAGFKRWEASHYAKLADNLIEKHNLAIILFGDKAEESLCESVASSMRHKCVVACGKTTVHQFASLAKKCYGMIVNDGGPLHISVAAGTRTVSIFGPVDEKVYGPYPKNQHVVVSKTIACRPCYRRFRRASCDHISCLKTITVEEVLERVTSIL